MKETSQSSDEELKELEALLQSDLEHDIEWKIKEIEEDYFRMRDEWFR